MMKRVFCSLAAVLVLLASFHLQHSSAYNVGGFVRADGTHFVLNGRPFYTNGFNAYWLMSMASDPAQRGKVTSAYQEASTHGLTLIRTWAFSDGGYGALQLSPGSYNEQMFKGLDFVVSEASKYGVRLTLVLVNNWNDYGGKNQYVQWARDQGQWLGSEDDFFKSDLVKGFFKNHIKKVLTRVNTITGVAYKDDPTIFAWELMNEPRCQSDLSGRTLQAWIEEMATHVKSIDSNHMLTIGIEGFYGESAPERKQVNPGYEVGTDFISNHQVPGIDFATVHAYPDQWVSGSSEEAQQAFLDKWLQSHIEDAGAAIKKPLLVAEFGKSSRHYEYTVGQRDELYTTIYDAIYASARVGGPCAGGLFWQLLAQGMDGYRDGYEVIFSECPSTDGIISQQSRRIANLNTVVPASSSPSSSSRKMEDAKLDQLVVLTLSP